MENINFIYIQVDGKIFYAANCSQTISRNSWNKNWEIYIDSNIYYNFFLYSILQWSDCENIDNSRLIIKYYQIVFNREMIETRTDFSNRRLRIAHWVCNKVQGR